MKLFNTFKALKDMAVRNMKVPTKGEHVKANRTTKMSIVTNTSMNDKAKKIDNKNKGDPRENGDLIRKKSR